MTVHRVLLVWVLLCPLVLGGCPQKCPQRFVSLKTLVAVHNVNARCVAKLWARARIRATLSIDGSLKLSWGSTSPLAGSNGYVMLWKEPDAPGAGPVWGGRVNFVLIGREVATDLFRVGANAPMGLYYCWYSLGDRKGAWVGRRELAGAPGLKAIPIDPLQLLEVLGLTPLPTPEPGAMPAVVMTLQHDPCAYVVRYLRPRPVTGHLKIWREVYFRWDDRRAPRPFRIKIFDADGLCRVVADVGRYETIAWDGPEDNQPVMPTDIRMTWPAIKRVQAASSVHIRLSQMSTAHEFGKGVFDLPAGLTEPICVDAAYGPIEQERLER